MSRTRMFRGFGSKKYWKWGTAVEVFKFSLYLAAPIGCASIYANPQVMHDLITKLNLVQYPEEAPQLTIEQYAESKRRFQAAVAADKLEQEKLATMGGITAKPSLNLKDKSMDI